MAQRVSLLLSLTPTLDSWTAQWKEQTAFCKLCDFYIHAVMCKAKQSKAEANVADEPNWEWGGDHTNNYFCTSL